MDAGTSISLRNDVLEKLKNALNDSSYRETIESSSNYNNRLVVERKTRIPFIDAQTGVAQNDCYLWMQKWERMPGITEGQLYSYPKKRWRKKKRSQYLVNNNYGVNIKQREKNPEKPSIELTMNGHETSTDNNLIDVTHHETTDKFFVETTTKEDWMNELDDVNEFNETLDNDEIESDFDEEYSSKKKKKKKNESGTGSGKKGKKVSNQTTFDTSSSDKPFKCDLCNMRYKTRPGLSYHYSHTHSVDVDSRKHLSLDEDDSQQSNSSLTNANGLNSRSSQISNSTSNSPLPPNSFNQNNLTSKSNFIANNLPSASPVLNNKIDDKNKIKKATTPSSYCDFCLGNSEINKKTRTSEEMISCHHCGRSAHPTCLQFTAKMIKAVKTYPWECLECKSCGICGHSDNDDQLLFCDDCDRGYHSNCVGLEEIPEGEWICNLCIVEYHSTDQSSKNEPSTNNDNKSKTDQITSNKTISSTSTSSSSNNTNSDNLLNTNSTSINSNNNSNKTSTNSHLKSDSKSPSSIADTNSTTIATTTESTSNSDKS